MSPAKRRSGNNVMSLDSGHAEKLKDLMLIMLETNQFDKSLLLSGPVIPEPNTSTF